MQSRRKSSRVVISLADLITSAFEAAEDESKNPKTVRRLAAAAVLRTLIRTGNLSSLEQLGAL